VTQFKFGAIDASEWIGPCLDMVPSSRLVRGGSLDYLVGGHEQPGRHGRFQVEGRFKFRRRYGTQGANVLARVMSGIARQVVRYQQPIPAPCVLLSGGETTVTVRGKGRGGRNVEFLLALAIALRGLPNVWAIAADTDGVDGAEEIAGAVVTPTTLQRATGLGLRASDCLADNDAHSFFEALNDQVVTGPTLTNVNDFRPVFVSAPSDVHEC
jgi:hypothetical protein